MSLDALLEQFDINYGLVKHKHWGIKQMENISSKLPISTIKYLILFGSFYTIYVTIFAAGYL